MPEQSTGGKSRKRFLLEVAANLAITIIGVLLGYYLGKAKGEMGKQPGFDDIQTQINLNDTGWEVTYQDVDEQRSAYVEFKQFGSRIVGQGRDNQGANWIVEGATAERRVCYIYFDTGGRRSFGTVMLDVDGEVKVMNGQWMGWAPDAPKLQPRKVTLRRVFK